MLTADRVQEETTTTGTGTLSLAGAVQGCDTFVAGIGNGNTCFYAIVHQTANEWEVGIGTVTDGTPDTLSRTTIIASSNSDAAVSFSAGTKRVWATIPARLLAKHVRTVDASETILDTDDVILAANTAARTLTLPAAAGRTGKEYTIVKTTKNSLGITIDGNSSETINGLTTWPIYHCGDVLRIKCDGSNWQVVGEVVEQKRVTTTDNTQTTLWSRTLEPNTAYLFKVYVGRVRTGGGSGAAGDGGWDEYDVYASRVGSDPASGTVHTVGQASFGTGVGTTGVDASSNDVRVYADPNDDTNTTWFVKVQQIFAMRFSD